MRLVLLTAQTVAPLPLNPDELTVDGSIIIMLRKGVRVSEECARARCREKERILT